MENVCYCDYCEAVITDDPILAWDEMGEPLTLCVDCWDSGYDRGVLTGRGEG